jgi:predicted amidohydrolase YtcJ
VDERHVQRVGSGEPPETDRLVELPGTTIIPGFIDAHVHLTGTGVRNAWPEASEARSAAELLDVLTKIAADRPKGVLAVHGWDESTWQPTDLPDLAELDKVSAEPLIAVRADGHVSVANTAALKQSRALELPGAETDGAGEPTGLISREANERLLAWFGESLDEDTIESYQLVAASLAASRGITCVHEMATPMARGSRDLEILLRHREQLPVSVIAYPATTDIPFVMDLGLARIGGDLSLDGSLGARTARLSRPYIDDDSQGTLYFEKDFLRGFLSNAHLAGLQVGLHAIGDEAIEQALSCWERVYQELDTRQRRHFRARRHRLEHFEMPGDGQIERAAALGLAISVQPAFDSTWGMPGRLYEQRLGEMRALSMNPFKTLLQRGLVSGAGSDSPVTSLDPMAAIDALERHHDSSQRFTREEAVRLHTLGGAQLAHLEAKKGRLEPGMHADFAAYGDDPMTASDVTALRPVLTVSKGRDVFAS